MRTKVTIYFKNGEVETVELEGNDLEITLNEEVLHISVERLD